VTLAEWPQYLAFPVAPLLVLAQFGALLAPPGRIRTSVVFGTPAAMVVFILAVAAWGFADDHDSTFYGSLSALVWLVVCLIASSVVAAADLVRAAVARTRWRPTDAAWAGRAAWALLAAFLAVVVFPPLVVAAAVFAAIAAWMSWKRERSRVRYLAVACAALTVVLAASFLGEVVFDSAASTAAPSRSTLTAAERARCGAQGSPVTLAELIRVFRANGVSLSMDDDTCRASPRERRNAALPDATNAGPSGLDDAADAREGTVFCSVGDRSGGAEVRVTKYETDTESSVDAFNVYCTIYPSSADREAAQIARLKRALRALAPVAAG
jgi:hypothetical protein